MRSALSDNQKERLLKYLADNYPYGIAEKYFLQAPASQESKLRESYRYALITNTPQSGSAEEELLNNLISKALNCSQNEVLISDSLASISLASKLSIVFGIDNEQIKAKKYTKNKLQLLSGNSLILTDELSELNKSQSKKKEFWLALKEQL